ncbi:MAG: CDP-diacylglycerol--serine O-phosphatidyltransferase [Oscillospiraceae bacterium]|nr:CDP-diacylglycerol--serine O-phosphatidyltransferase [Oscillospiraceae bacterium]
MKKHIPNIFTLLNLSAGLTVILLLLQPEHPHKQLIAPVLIVMGGVADFFDGYLARKLNAVTDMGKQLDSFADIITFGVAPVCLVMYRMPHQYFTWIAAVCLLYVVAGAYRLARYNLNDFRDHFIGLPITAAGIILAAYCSIYSHWTNEAPPVINAAITGMVMLLLGIMMVSRKKFRRFCDILRQK